MKLIAKKTLLIIFFFIISSCHPFNHPYTMDLDVPDGPPEFKAGWYDGCRSVLSTKKFANYMHYKLSVGNGLYQTNPVYYSGWNSAFILCQARTGRFVGKHPFNSYPLE